MNQVQSSFHTSLSEELKWRGFFAENTITDPRSLDSRPHKNFYWGTDPSADSLHVGHLAALMMCACFVRHGYTPFYLVGGATGQIGDPKETAERDLKSLDEIAKNKAALAAQIVHVTHSPKDTKILDNLDWFKDIKFLPFLREIGKAFSMTQLLDRQFVQHRIGKDGSGISYAEFSYTLIQGYDFLHLFRTHQIDLQLCGADQYGNCTSGMHLIRRLENARADVYSCPLILDQSGKKLSKSEGNAVWLDPTKTNVFDFYQYWLNQPDAVLESYLKQFTLISPTELDDLLTKHTKDPSKRLAQRYLAYAVTEFVHSQPDADLARKLTSLLFESTDLANDLTSLTDAELDAMTATLPSTPAKTTLIDALLSTQLATSKNDAKKLIAAGAISINGTKATTDQAIDTLSLLKKGKNKFAIVR
ncbi:tyrosine--tRNA ligase [Candidatus Saccharibacteria bacterium]|nr:tyrosine--tRNA ligase [Candidatus Saccharibacteria bacterium]